MHAGRPSPTPEHGGHVAEVVGIKGHIQHSAAEVAEALLAARGIVSAAAGRLGVSPQAVRKRISGSATLRAVLADAREGALDLAEERLFDQVDAGEAWAICFYLKTQGRGRGYVEKSQHEHTGAAGGPLRIVIETIDDRPRPDTPS